MSKGKEAIYNLLLESTSHLTAENIYFILKGKMPSIAMGTVYRNLNILLEEGKIRRLTYPNDADHYDNVKMVHDHARCIRCGKIFDVPKFQIDEINGDWILLDYELNARIICKDCKEECDG